MQTLLLLGVVLTAFAANSILCRLALGSTHSDPVSFTAIRIASGAVCLAGLLLLRGELRFRGVNPGGVFFLYLYAICFSLAYVRLDAATGALILFAAVQFTMMAVALGRGERPHMRAWAGLLIAAAGLAYLLAPEIKSPSMLAAGLMLSAGVAWGGYSTLGARSSEPLVATAWNFIVATPFALLALLFAPGELHLDRQGLLYAVLSGAGASGLGYALWYHVLPRITGVVAAGSQLLVPVIAAVGGMLLLNEAPSARLLSSGVVILLGFALLIYPRNATT